MKYDVFLSYRHAGGAEKAELLKSVLMHRGYKSSRIFMDTHNLGNGNFHSGLKDAISESLNIIVVIHKDCFKDMTSDSNWVREISEAIEQGKNIVPIYFDGIESIEKDSLPDAIKDLPLANAVIYVHQYSEASYDRLCDRLLKEGTSMPKWAKWAVGVVAAAGAGGGAVSLVDSMNNDKMVYVIDSSTSRKYHDNLDCTGIRNARHEVKTVTLKEAVKMGKTPCSICVGTDHDQ